MKNWKLYLVNTTHAVYFIGQIDLENIRDAVFEGTECLSVYDFRRRFKVSLDISDIKSISGLQ